MNTITIELTSSSKYAIGTRLLVKVYDEAYLGTVTTIKKGYIHILLDNNKQIKVKEKSKLILGKGIKRKITLSIPLKIAYKYIIDGKPKIKKSFKDTDIDLFLRHIDTLTSKELVKEISKFLLGKYYFDAKKSKDTITIDIKKRAKNSSNKNLTKIGNNIYKKLLTIGFKLKKYQHKGRIQSTIYYDILGSYRGINVKLLIIKNGEEDGYIFDRINFVLSTNQIF